MTWYVPLASARLGGWMRWPGEQNGLDPEKRNGQAYGVGEVSRERMWLFGSVGMGWSL
jgi:hypothetical protein